MQRTFPSGFIVFIKVISLVLYKLLNTHTYEQEHTSSSSTSLSSPPLPPIEALCRCPTVSSRSFGRKKPKSRGELSLTRSALHLNITFLRNGKHTCSSPSHTPSVTVDSLYKFFRAVRLWLFTFPRCRRQTGLPASRVTKATFDHLR